MRRTGTGLGPWFTVLLSSCRARSSPGAQQTPARRSFRSDVNLVVVDVVVRDRAGAVVRGLTAADFEVREDDKPQQVTSFDVEEVAPPHRSLALLRLSC